MMINIHNPLNDQKLPTHLLTWRYLVLKFTSSCLVVTGSWKEIFGLIVMSWERYLYHLLSSLCIMGKGLSQVLTWIVFEAGSSQLATLKLSEHFIVQGQYLGSVFQFSGFIRVMEESSLLGPIIFFGVFGDQIGQIICFGNYFFLVVLPSSLDAYLYKGI